MLILLYSRLQEMIDDISHNVALLWRKSVKSLMHKMKRRGPSTELLGLSLGATTNFAGLIRTLSVVSF